MSAVSNPAITLLSFMPICQIDEIRLTNSALSTFFVKLNSMISAFNLSHHKHTSGPKQYLSNSCKISVTCVGNFNNAC